jgi:hypothetical protein
MDDQHQKTRDADKGQEQAANRARSGERPGERHNNNESTSAAMSDSANNEKGKGRDGEASTVSDAMGQVTSLVRNAGEQAWSAASNAGGTAQEMARQARDQVSGALTGSSARAGEYLTRNVNEYPLAALLVAGAIGYGVAYLFHNSWESDGKKSATRSDASSNRSGKR